MQVYLFIDLDDTLFQTRRKCPEDAVLQTAAFGRDGTPLSFMTPKQRGLWEWLGQGARVIPTTARNHDAFRRVNLPFSGQAILDFGAVILSESGQPEERWDGLIRGQAAKVRDALHETHARIGAMTSRSGLEVRTRIVGDFGMDLYVVSKQADIEADDLCRLHEQLRDAVDLETFYLHFNDNNLSVIPRFLGKRYAVEYLIETHLRAEGAEIITVGMGDSLSDLSFMSACDYSMMPNASQIMQAFAELPHV